MNSPKMSLEDLLGVEYVQSVGKARALLAGEDTAEISQISCARVDFFPEGFQKRLNELLETIGKQVVDGLADDLPGAGTNSFNKASMVGASPLSALGFIRIGEDGKGYLISKSEHYHASLGHAFPGYQLVENARKLGIPNATHNNTRGYITRKLEQELVRAANGISVDDDQKLMETLASREPHILNRVINLETGSLAVEAAVKMMLARFYRPEETSDQPPYSGRRPVFLVMADWEGGKRANYHGTTLFTQFMRGMWPELAAKLATHSIFEVQPVQINDIAHFKETIEKYDQAPYKVAGFIHEIVLMNYGGILVEREYLQQAYNICHQYDVPVMVDEIQSCMWSPDFFMFREYGLNPDFVSIGKGFPGGEYPASRILSTFAYDNLSQFGALVTNGQEELASLAYLVTMQFLRANREQMVGLGNYYHSKLRSLVERFPEKIQTIEGERHLSTIFFFQADEAIRFAKALNSKGIDISLQTYKASCPPAVLTKIPLISSPEMVDFLVSKMVETLEGL